MTIQVSVIVPTFRRPRLLNRCLSALQNQAFDPAAYEIIVVDDGDSEATRRLVQSRSTRKSAPRPGQSETEKQKADRCKARPCLRYLSTGHRRGPAAARNLGWRAARGSIIAFTDDDCIPHPRWLCEGIAPLRHNGHVGVSGRVVVPLPAAPTDYEHNIAHMQDSIFLTANCFYRRAALEEVGGFDERFTRAWREDSDLLFTMVKHYGQAGHFVQAPQAVVYHPPRRAAWGVSVKQQRKSMFNALLYKKHPHGYRSLIQTSPPWHYYGIVGSLLAMVAARLLGRRRLGSLSAALWLLQMLRFFLQRLAGTSRAPGHVLEMLVTSILIPPLSVFWRLVGALKFRVFFL